MIRNCSLEEISDGKLYSENDMVKTDTNQCQGCNSVCCHGMGDSIVLDPYDICRLCYHRRVFCKNVQVYRGCQHQQYSRRKDYEGTAQYTDLIALPDTPRLIGAIILSHERYHRLTNSEDWQI